MSGWIDRIEELRVDGLINENAGKLTKLQATQRFKDGEGGFAIITPAEAFAAPQGTFDAVGYWAGPGALSGPPAGTSNGLMMTEYGENKEAAGRLMQYISQLPQLELWYETTGEMPGNDRFDEVAGELPPLEKQSWDFIAHSDPEPIWPHDYSTFTLVEDLHAVQLKLMEGKGVDACKAELAERIERAREENQAQTQSLERFIADDPVDESGKKKEPA
jgi:hypothetical protein